MPWSGVHSWSDRERHIRRTALKWGNLNKELEQDIIRTQRVIEYYLSLILELEKQKRSLIHQRDENLDQYLEAYEQFRTIRADAEAASSKAR